MKKLSDFALCTQCYHTWQSRDKTARRIGPEARARDCDGRFGDLCHFEAELTDMQENTWARLRDLCPGTHVLTHIFSCISIPLKRRKNIPDSPNFPPEFLFLPISPGQ